MLSKHITFISPFLNFQENLKLININKELRENIFLLPNYKVFNLINTNLLRNPIYQYPLQLFFLNNYCLFENGFSNIIKNEIKNRNLLSEIYDMTIENNQIPSRILFLIRPFILNFLSLWIYNRYLKCHIKNKELHLNFSSLNFSEGILLDSLLDSINIFNESISVLVIDLSYNNISNIDFLKEFLLKRKQILELRVVSSTSHEEDYIKIDLSNNNIKEFDIDCLCEIIRKDVKNMNNDTRILGEIGGNRKEISLFSAFSNSIQIKEKHCHESKTNIKSTSKISISLENNKNCSFFTSFPNFNMNTSFISNSFFLLHELNLSNCSSSIIHIISILEVGVLSKIDSFLYLNLLNLSYNDLNECLLIDKIINIINHSNIKRLSLNYCNLKEKALERLFSIFNISDLNDKSKGRLGRILLKKKNLINSIEELFLKGNYIHLQSFYLFSKILNRNKSNTLQVLDISKNNLNFKGRNEKVHTTPTKTNVNSSKNLGFQRKDKVEKTKIEGVLLGEALNTLLKNNIHLKELNLSDCFLDDLVALSFIDSLKENKKLIKLDISYNNFSEKGLKYIKESLQLSSSIKSLVINGIISNYIFSPLLSSTNKLLHLSASSLNLNSEDVFSFTSKEKRMVSLDISGNNFNDNSIFNMEDYISNHFSLLFLNVSYNKLCDKAISLLTKYLFENKTIKVIDLSYNTFTDESMRSLNEVIWSHHSLIELNLSGNQLTTVGLKVLFNGFEVFNKNKKRRNISNSKGNYYLSIDERHEVKERLSKNNEYQSKSWVSRIGLADCRLKDEGVIYILDYISFLISYCIVDNRNLIKEVHSKYDDKGLIYIDMYNNLLTSKIFNLVLLYGSVDLTVNYIGFNYSQISFIYYYIILYIPI